jgi:hypothetical protein
VNGRQLVAKPIGMAAGAAGGAAFRTIWRRVDAGREVPKAQDATRSWRAVLLAAALQGAVFAVIHAIVDRVTSGRAAEADAEAEAEAEGKAKH